VSGQRRALIVANDEYEHEQLRNLQAPAADTEALGRVLGDPKIGEFSVQVVHNEPSYVIQATLEQLFSESRPDDVLLVHFSGHGLKSESGELFFVASNTRLNRLDSTAVSADFVQRCMRASRSRIVVVLLDCCYGGDFAQGAAAQATGDVNVLDSFLDESTGGGRGRAVITGSKAMEYAFEGGRLADDHCRRPSVFTNALVEGLATGDADLDEDGWVSLNELYNYVFDKVREHNPYQTPSRRVELEGELYLARSRRRRIRPAPIPPELQAAMTDPNMFTRLGAVHELQSRLASDDLPTAAGAYQALAELARTDVQYVAGPATAALSQAAVRPEVTKVDFGEQRQGSTPPHRRIRLLGPPIARACTPRTSDDWIRVNETVEGLDVWVDTAHIGALRGSLNLKGPAGEAVIVIEVAIVPPPLPAKGATGSAGPPVKVFVNYRHEDTPGAAWALYLKLEERFGAENVFFEQSSLRSGMRWFEEVRSRPFTTGVFLALIGPRWMSILATRSQRGDVDYVVKEIDLALRSGPPVTVIPVLVDDAEIPDPPSLPPALRALPKIQVERLRHATFLYDIEHLIAQLSEIAESATTDRAAPAALSAPRPPPAPAAPPVASAAPPRRLAGADETPPLAAPSRPPKGPAGQERQPTEKTHGHGHGRGKRQRSAVDPQGDAVSRAVKEAVKPGLLTFNPPATMVQGRKERVEVGIARSPELREALTTGLRGRGKPQVEGISTSSYMGVELRGDAFEVTSFSPAEQLVAPLARWEFDVTPYRAGHQSLTLCVSLRIDSPEITGGRIAVPVLEREIQIQVDIVFGVRRFLAKNWQWLIATILGLGGALAAWITLVAK
jgi:Caspase domain/TIR domain